MAENHNPAYYLKCMAGGFVACSISRTSFVPLDVVKCRRQIDPNLYRGLFDGLVKIGSREGIRGLLLVLHSFYA
jgi:solute carrier family 25 phosphate transporter 3